MGCVIGWHIQDKTCGEFLLENVLEGLTHEC